MKRHFSMSVLNSAKVETFYCQPVSQFQVQHWKILTPLINWGTPWHKLMTTNQGPTGISQTLDQSAATHLASNPNRIPIQYCTQNTDQLWSRHLRCGLLRCPSAESSPVPTFPCTPRTQQQLLTVAHSHGSIVIGYCNEVIHVWACSWVADKLRHVQTPGRKHKTISTPVTITF